MKTTKTLTSTHEYLLPSVLHSNYIRLLDYLYFKKTMVLIINFQSTMDD